jgi:glutamyl-tRNA reductase
MPVFVAGLNFRTAPVELLGRLAVGEDLRAKALAHLLDKDHVDEAVILSTCNRVEVYAAIRRFHGGASEVRRALAEVHHLDPNDFAHHLYDYFEERAVHHLFRVTAGLDSMVVGEGQVLTQVREAFAAAEAEGAVSSVLSTLFQRAIRAGRRARAETGIGGQLTSTVSVGLELAKHQLGTLAGRRALVVGAGQMGRLAGQLLREGDAGELVVANRTADRGAALAERFGARAVPLEGIEDELVAADLVVASTAAMEPTVTRDVVARAVARRRQLPPAEGSRAAARPLILLDLGVPSDVDARVRELDGVVLADLDGLRAVVEAEGGPPAAEVARARTLVDEETEGFIAWQRESRLGPTIRDLRARAERIRAGELAKSKARLAGLDDRQLAAVETITRGVVNKLLHDPVVNGKALAAGPDGELYVRTLRELFGLDGPIADGRGGTSGRESHPPRG